MVAGKSIIWVLALGATGWAAAAWGGDWPGWRGENRDGKASESGLLKAWPEGGPKLIWKAPGLGKGFSSAAVVQNVIYTSGDVEKDLVLYALDAQGKLVWKAVQGPAFTASHGGARSTPVVDGTRVYLIGGSGVVTCHGTADGALIWKRELKAFGGAPGGWGYAESALVLDDKVIVTPGGPTGLVALDKATGADIWRSDVACKAHYSSAIVIGEKDDAIIVQGTGSGLIAVRAKDGRKVWTSDFCAGNTANCPDPAYADGYLFWANGYGKGGICFQVQNRDGVWSFTEAWRSLDMVCHHGGYVIEQGRIYGNHNQGWTCLDLKTGKTVWKNTSGFGKGSLCFADGMLYLFAERGGKAGLAAAVPTGFAQSGEVRVEGGGPSWAHPVVANGRLYLRYDTTLYCFDVAAKSN